MKKSELISLIKESYKEILLEAKSTKALAKDYDLATETDYFDMVDESVINGNRTQAKSQFNAMDAKGKKSLIKYLTETISII